jgi:hypothetical protein
MTTEEFEGLPVNGHSLALKGTGDGLSNAMAISKSQIRKGDTVFLLIRASAGAVKFVPDNDMDAWKSREQTLVAETIAIVDAAFAETRINEQRAAEDRKRGIVPIPVRDPADRGEVVHTDENGVVLTEAEVAERQGRGAPVVALSPAVVEYDGDPDRRRMWPDEFDRGEPRPEVGALTVDGVVTSLLDPTSGAVIEVGGSPDGTANADGDPSTSSESTEGGDDDVLIGDVPAGDEFPSSGSPAGDADPGLVDFLAGSVGEVKVRVEANLGVSFLSRALEVELGASKARPGVVSALKDRIAVLDGFA